jgi:beta-galactosidase/beta-glucuronidase
VALLLWAAIPAGAAEWQPARGPLKTRWGADVSPDRVHPEYPRPQMRRPRWQNLNGLWQLAVAGESEAPPLGRDLTEHILVPFPVESALSGVMKRAERLWYRRHFTVPRDWAGQRVLLHFGAVDWEAKVWVNGRLLTTHRGGYDAFSSDVTDALKPGGQQELVVGVWDPSDGGTQPRGKQVRKPSGIWYTPTTGIWQTVWLEPVPAAGIGALKIVPDVPGRKAIVTVTGLDGAARHAVRLTCRDGKEVAATAEGRLGESVDLKLTDPKLWSPETPFLYDLRVEVNDSGRVVDAVDGYFAMRSVGIGPDGKGVMRLLLNGKPVFQVGPLDQGFWPDGLYTAPTDEALRFDVAWMKKLGFNMVRKHVKVEPDRWYWWCDKLGLLVWQDMPSGDRNIDPGKPDLRRSPESARQYERELRAMIDGLYNHPCVVQWVVFNEGWGQFDTERITRWTKEYDPTRLVDCASGWNDRAVGDVLDIHVYPGPGAPPPPKDRAGVLGEFGGLGLGVDGHTWAAKSWSYQGTASREELTRRYERLWQRVHGLREERGLAAAVYTQLTDVETEINGLLTYDRAVLKVDPARAAAAARGDFSAVPQMREVVPTSQDRGLLWRYTFDRPAADWFRADFDDSGWKQGPGGFGTKWTPGAVVRTEWKTGDVWIRRAVSLPARLPAELYLRLHHDEDAEVYLNGVLAAKVSGYTTEYEDVPVRPEARAALQPGRNVIAVHCRQTTGGQYIDVGLFAAK